METSNPLKGFTILVAGKGGTGKTLTSALLVRNQIKHGAVFAIDADPDSNLPEALGVEIAKTVGDIRESALEFKTRVTENTTTPTEKVMEQGIMEALAEEKGFDLLVMGRSEGEGCYCHVNHILRSIIDTHARNYDTVVIDSEAGLEHISRRTARDVDVMLVVSDASAKGIATARRVKELASELRIEFGHTLLLANKITDQTRDIIAGHVEKEGLDLLGFIPFDPNVSQLDALGNSIWELPEDSPVMIATNEAFQKLEDLRQEKLNRIMPSINVLADKK
ncbi:AAA family ATPase [Thermodesulfobacteriota bacterium]